MIDRRTALKHITLAPSFAVASIKSAHSGKVDVTQFIRDGEARPGGRELQLAVNASREWGVPAFIPAGCTVLLKNEPSIVLHSGSAIQGAGPSSVIAGLYDVPSPNCLIKNDWFRGSSGIHLSDFAIDRSGKGVEHGILLNGANSLTIERLSIYGRTRAISGAIAVSCVMNASRNIRVLSSSKIRVSSCSISDCGNFGVQLGRVAGAEICGNVFPKAFREAIGIEPEACDMADEVIICHNRIEAIAGVRQGSETGLIVLTRSSGASAIRHVSVHNNEIQQSDKPAAGTMPGIAVYGDINAVISRNYVRGVPGPGIQLGNLFKKTFGCGGSNLVVSGLTRNTEVIGNVIESCNSGLNKGPRGAAIYSRASEGVTVSGNRVIGGTHTADYSFDK